MVPADLHLRLSVAKRCNSQWSPAVILAGECHSVYPLLLISPFQQAHVTLKCTISRDVMSFFFFMNPEHWIFQPENLTHVNHADSKKQYFMLTLASLLSALRV